MTTVKICGLTNLEDARWAAHCGADLLGLIFVPSSPRFIEPSNAAQITSALRAEGCACQLVGVFAGSTPGEIRHTVSVCHLDLVQLHGYRDDVCLDIGTPVIVAKSVRDKQSWAPDPTGACRNVYAYLLDTYDPDRLGGTGQTWDWSSMDPSPDRSMRVIIAGGLDSDNVREAIRLTRPWGVDVSSGVEKIPGRKDHDKVQRFILNVREEDAEHACH